MFQFLDTFLSNRFTNAMRIYQEYGMPVLGQRVELISVQMARENGTNIALLDVAYLRILIQAGPIFLALIMAMYCMAFRLACLRNDRYSLVVMALFVLFGISESGFNNALLNFSLLMAWKALYTKKLSAGGIRKPDGGRDGQESAIRGGLLRDRKIQYRSRHAADYGSSG